MKPANVLKGWAMNKFLALGLGSYVRARGKPKILGLNPVPVNEGRGSILKGGETFLGLQQKGFTGSVHGFKELDQQDSHPPSKCADRHSDGGAGFALAVPRDDVDQLFLRIRASHAGQMDSVLRVRWEAILAASTIE